MIIRTLKQLSPEEAKRIRSASRTLQRLREIFKASGFLKEDLEKNKNATVLQNAWTGPPFLQEEIGAFVRPKYFPNLATFGTFSYIPAANEKSRYTRNINIKIWLGEHNTANNKTFKQKDLEIHWDGYPYTNVNESEFRFGHLNTNNSRQLEELINFFYDKKALYKKSSKFLEKNKKLLATLLGAHFLEDLLALFSAKWATKNIPNFNFPSENLEKFLIIQWKNYDDLGNKEEHIGTFYKTSSSKTSLRGGIKSLQLLLNDQDKLTVDIVLDDSYITLMRLNSLTSKNVADFIQAKEYKNIINENLNTWLKTLVCLANFATAIYEKIKLKLLLENI